MEPVAGMRFVRLRQSNAHVLDAVADDVFDDRVDANSLLGSLRDHQLLVVATVSGTVVGQVQAMVQHHIDGPPQLYVDNLGVSPAHQRRGVARGLIAEVVAWSGELGCTEAWVVTDLDNLEANALYASLGARRSTVALYSLDRPRTDIPRSQETGDDE